MGDQYRTGQAGAVGPSSHAHDMNFNQIWNEMSPAINSGQLADELARLRVSLRAEAKEPEHDQIIGKIADAEIAVRNGKGAEASITFRW